MPELPEVETIRRGLAEVLPGKRLAKLELRLPKLSALVGPAQRRAVLGRRVSAVERRGKLLLIRLAGDVTIVIHLKMTGQLIYRERRRLRLAGGHPTTDIGTVDYPIKATQAIFTFHGGSELFFNDQRTFGYVKVLPDEAVEALPLVAAFGPDPTSRQFSLEVFRAMLGRRPQAKLKPLLLDQTIIAGLGNIYVDESLNLAKLHPLRQAGALTGAQQQALYEAIRTILRKALRYRGTSDNSYVTIRGGRGDYLKHARVYHRVDQPCPACGTPISRMVVVGRGTHYCRKCQRPPRKGTPLSRRRLGSGPGRARPRTVPGQGQDQQ